MAALSSLSALFFSSQTAAAGETRDANAAVQAFSWGPAETNGLSFMTHGLGKETETRKRRVSLGLNYPGISLKFFPSSTIAFEARVQRSGKVTTVGGRLYWYPDILGFDDSQFRPFLAVEGDYISFAGEFSRGAGIAAGGFAGLEYFVGKRISIQTDAGPVYIGLKDGRSALRQSGLEYVLNFGVNFTIF